MRAEARIERIFHPSDFSKASDVAFNHALKIAIAVKADLTILHTGEKRHDSAWADFPRVRQTLERWQLLPPDSPREALHDLGVDVVKVAAPPGDPARSILRYLGKYPHDLIVLATHQRDGLDRWLHASVASPVARRSAEMTLFVPHGVEGIVSDADGSTRLTEILVPASRFPDPQFAINVATSVAEALGCQKAHATLLHVGKALDLPELRFPATEALEWRTMLSDGNVEEEILRAAAHGAAGLIVMSTEGHRDFLDALRGSTTERIVRTATCPVLAVPAHATQPQESVLTKLATGRLTTNLA